MLNPEDLKIEVIGRGPPGGQQVGYTSTVIRITHIPTGIFSMCDTERSQMKNRDIALKELESKVSKHLQQKEGE